MPIAAPSDHRTIMAFITLALITSSGKALGGLLT
jgi:hypothetical protein